MNHRFKDLPTLSMNFRKRKKHILIKVLLSFKNLLLKNRLSLKVLEEVQNQKKKIVIQKTQSKNISISKEVYSVKYRSYHNPSSIYR